MFQYFAVFKEFFRFPLGLFVAFLPCLVSAAEEQQDLWGIEGLYSQQFSVAIFYFLVFSIVIFTVIVFAFMFGGKSKSLKRGEKIMFIWIFIGIVVAVVFGAVQMLHGFLF